MSLKPACLTSTEDRLLLIAYYLLPIEFEASNHPHSVSTQDEPKSSLNTSISAFLFTFKLPICPLRLL